MLSFSVGSFPAALKNIENGLQRVRFLLRLNTIKLLFSVCLFPDMPKQECSHTQKDGLSFGILRITSFKNRFFYRIKELFKSNQTRHGRCAVYIESKSEIMFAIAGLGKKLRFHLEICNFWE